MDRLDIMSYGISMTTLEEVFLRANEAHRDEDDSATGAERIDELLIENPDGRSKRGSSLQHESP